MTEHVYRSMLHELWGMAANIQTARLLRLFEDRLMKEVEKSYGKVRGVEQLSSVDSQHVQWMPVHQGGPLTPNSTPYDPYMAILFRF